MFDCLYRDGRDLRREPLTRRRAALESSIGENHRRETIFVSALLASNGLKAFEAAQKKGFEGVVAKDSSAPYIEGRSQQMAQIEGASGGRVRHRRLTPRRRDARQHFGALLLGAYEHGKLRYVGKVGTGFSRDSLAALYRKFQPLVRAKPAVGDPPREKDVTYLAPRLVAQIAYEELTDDRKLRQPVFLGLARRQASRRTSLCRRRNESREAAFASRQNLLAGGRLYQARSGALLRSRLSKLKPYVADRMLSLERCPDGMSGQCFYQKQAPKGLPADTPIQADPA